MRKSCLVLFSALLLYCASHSQETAILKIAHNYFRSDPFSSQFSSFMTHLLNDPTITGKIIEKKTDSTLFYFQGTYTTHNPFFFKPKRVQVVLTELVVKLDSLSADTIFNYQLFAYTDDTKQGVQDVKKEFDKIFRHYKGSFHSNQYAENPAGDNSGGATYNFFDLWHAIAPFALSWFGPNENKEMCLVLTIRMDNRNNLAILPAPFYAPQ